jgi:hypothetical protein
MARPSEVEQERRRSRTRPPSSDLDPFGETASFLALYIDNVSITFASASYTILTLTIPCLPILILLFSFLLIKGGHFEIGYARQLASRRIGRTMLDGGVSVAEVTEVVYVFGFEECTGSEGMDGCITPL